MKRIRLIAIRDGYFSNAVDYFQNETGVASYLYFFHFCSLREGLSGNILISRIFTD